MATTAKVPAKKVAAKAPAAKAPVRAVAKPAEHHRLTHAERLQRKTQNMGEMTISVSDALYSVTLTGRTPVEHVGHLLELNDKYVVFRYKKERSSKTVVSRFLTSDVVRIIGEVGGPASVLLLKNAPFVTFNGRVEVLKNGYIRVTDEATQDSMLVNPNLRMENFSLFMNSELSKSEEDGEEEAAPKARTKKPAAAVAAAPKKKVRKPATVNTVEEEDDEEMEEVSDDEDFA